MFIVILNENNITKEIQSFKDKRFQEIAFMKECQKINHEPTDIDFKNQYFTKDNKTVQMSQI